MIFKFKLNQNSLLGVALIFAVLISILWDQTELKDGSARINEFLKTPLSFGVKTRSMDPTKNEEAILGSALVVKNVYQINQQQFLVMALDGTKNRQAVHDPAHCFHSSGWTIDVAEDYSLPNGTASRLEIHQKDNQTEVMFWYSNGAAQHASPVSYWFQSTFRRLTLGLSGDEQVLILIQKLTDQEKTDWSTLFEKVPALTKI